MGVRKISDSKSDLQGPEHLPFGDIYHESYNTLRTITLVL